MFGRRARPALCHDRPRGDGVAGLLATDPFGSRPEGLIQALVRGISRTRARELPMPRESRAPNLREHEARRILTQVAKTCVKLGAIVAAGWKHAEASTATMALSTGAGAGSAGVEPGRVVLEHLSQSTRGKDG